MWWNQTNQWRPICLNHCWVWVCVQMTDVFETTSSSWCSWFCQSWILLFTLNLKLIKSNQIKSMLKALITYTYTQPKFCLQQHTHTHMYTLSQTTTGCMRKLLYFLRKWIACTSHFIVFTKNKVNQIWMQNIIETSNIYNRDYLFSSVVILAKWFIFSWNSANT